MPHRAALNLRLLLVFVLTSVLLGCNSETELPPSTGISVHDAKKMSLNDQQVVVLDVRTPKEFSRSHIDGALNINIHSPDFSTYVSKLDRDKTYIIHCAVNPRGGRGDKSIYIMSQLGFDNLLSLDGGFKAWKRAGLPFNST